MALVFLFALPWVRSVFSSASVKVCQLEQGAPPGPSGPLGPAGGVGGWRAVTRVLRSRGKQQVPGMSGGSMSGGVWSFFQQGVRVVVGDLANVLLPDDCRLCGAAMVASSPVRVCEACVGRLATTEDDVAGALCSRCGEAMGLESARFRVSLGLTECPACRMVPPAFERAVAAGDYDDTMRELLHELKFGGRTRLASYVLGERLAQAVCKLDGLAAAELVVVPVPLFKQRERRRGFNQATVLAESAVKVLRKTMPVWKLRLDGSVMARVKDTRELYRLTPKQRRAGLQGAFRVERPERIAGREVLLIDDILTTGATARECARVLRRAGATKVWVATVARAQPMERRFAAERDGFEHGAPTGSASWTTWDM